MVLARVLAVPAACLAALGSIGLGAAAGSHAGIWTQQKVAGAYRLTLAIGPAQAMGSMANMGGGMVVGGKPATCRLPGETGSGTSMHAPTCNRDIELHVFDAKTNKVQIRARVTISLRNTKKHLTIAVPVMMMMGSGGLKDFHYGNNFSAAAGTYAIAVTVNGVHAAFTATLR